MRLGLEGDVRAGPQVYGLLPGLIRESYETRGKLLRRRPDWKTKPWIPLSGLRGREEQPEKEEESGILWHLIRQIAVCGKWGPQCQMLKEDEG